MDHDDGCVWRVSRDIPRWRNHESTHANGAQACLAPLGPVPALVIDVHTLDMYSFVPQALDGVTG